MISLQASSFGKALYYPYISVEDVNWLKTALLYWDGLCQMVPKDISFLSTRKEISMAADAGILVNRDPTDCLLAAESRFREYVFPLIETNMEPVAQSLRTASDKFIHGPSESTVEMVHRSKMSHRLIQELESRKLVRGSDHWIRMPANLCGLYSLCLASEMSEELGMPLVSDTGEYAEFSNYLMFGEPFQPREDQARVNLVMELGIKMPSPRALEQIPMVDMLEFHRTYSDERKQLRRELERIGREAVSISHPDALADFIDANRVAIKKSVDDYNRTVDTLKLQRLTGMLANTFYIGSALMSYAAISNSPLAAICAGIGITINLGATWCMLKQIEIDRAGVMNSPWRYVSLLKDEFPTSSKER